MLATSLGFFKKDVCCLVLFCLLACLFGFLFVVCLFV